VALEQSLNFLTQPVAFSRGRVTFPVCLQVLIEVLPQDSHFEI